MAKASKPKRVQGPKTGKVIRINKDLMDYIQARRKAGDTWSKALERLIGDGARPSTGTMWTLPSKLLPSKSEAVGIAIHEAVEQGRDLGGIEAPVEVREA